jgi:hypothetical protein
VVEIVLAMRYAYLTDPGSLGIWGLFIIGPVLIAGVMLLIRYRAEVRRDPGPVIAGVLGGCILAAIFAVLPYDLLSGRLPDSMRHLVSYVPVAYLIGIELARGYFWTWIKWLRDRMRPALLPLFPPPVPPYVAPPSAHGKRPVDPPIAKPTTDGH